MAQKHKEEERNSCWDGRNSPDIFLGKESLVLTLVRRRSLRHLGEKAAVVSGTYAVWVSWHQLVGILGVRAHLRTPVWRCVQDSFQKAQSGQWAQTGR